MSPAANKKMTSYLDKHGDGIIGRLEASTVAGVQRDGWR